MVTGESIPVDKSAGDRVIGGTMNVNGAIEFRATAVGSATVLQRIVKLVEEAQGSKAPIQHMADRIASVFVPTVIAIAASRPRCGWSLCRSRSFRRSSTRSRC